ncbi:MAG TPA: MFS transporter [Sedimenticola sp.]|nr:MFS transporter [Sedimenticola sp.]
MRNIKTHKVEQLVMAAVAFFWCFLMWFASAAFVPTIASEFDLGIKGVALLASSAIWTAPILRPLAGWSSDKIGAPATFVVILVICGGFSILSAYAKTLGPAIGVTEYQFLFWTRVIVAAAGISFVVGIQHVAQWFESEEMGAAEGLYAGTGNVGAGVGALMLPRLYGLDYRTAFIHLGIVAFIIALWILFRGVAAKSVEQAAMAKKTATMRDTIFIWTRHAAIALMFAYAMCFGLEIGMNAWLPGYYKIGFAEAIKSLGFESLKDVQIAAGSFAAVQSFNASLFRPFSGWISDIWQRNRWMPFPLISKKLYYAPRIHWLMFALLCITTTMILLTVAGLSGNVVWSVLILAFFGITVAFGTGGTFAIVPLMFKERPGTATGFIGGVSCAGGIVYPLIYGNAAGWFGEGGIHMGYAFVAVTMFIPFILYFIWSMHWDIHPEDHGFGSKEKWLGKTESEEAPAAAAATTTAASSSES